MTTHGSDPYRSGRSPGYLRTTCRSSLSVSPRRVACRDSSSAPARNAARSFRLSWRRCSAAAAEGSGGLITVMDILGPEAGGSQDNRPNARG